MKDFKKIKGKFSRLGLDLFTESDCTLNYRYMRCYSEYIFDYVTYWKDSGKIDISYEEWYFGGIDYKNESFETFKEFEDFYKNLRD